MARTQFKVNQRIARQKKQFKVASISSNHNSFGLTGMILVARDGEAWEVGANSINVKKKGDVLSVPLEDSGYLDFACFGFEIPSKLSTCPPGAVKEIWG